MASVMDALRVLALQRNAVLPQGDMPYFNRAFLKTVRLFGRTYDIGMITAYKLHTSTFKHDMDKIPAMMFKKKLAFLPSFGADGKTVRRIFKHLEPAKGKE